jgi:peptide/nickel transport system ATP-binding protein
MLLITHDLGYRRPRRPSSVSVMYAGRRSSRTRPRPSSSPIPRHPYTQGLLRCVPVPGKQRQDEPLGSIPGTVPRIGPGFEGCGFRDRCSFADASCARTVPHRTAAPGHDYLCRLAP